jgi:hypothetical protein
VSKILIAGLDNPRSSQTFSGVHHLEEIKKSGLDAPAVNQIEVGFYISRYEDYEVNRINSFIHSVNKNRSSNTVKKKI